MSIVMNFGWEVSADVFAKINAFDEGISRISKWFLSQSFEDRISNISILINCKGHISGYSGPYVAFETGEVVKTKYIKSRKRFEISVRLSYDEVVSLTSNKSLTILAHVIVVTLCEISHVTNIYTGSLLKEFINKFYLIDADKYYALNSSSFLGEEKPYFLDDSVEYSFLNEKNFWNFINLLNLQLELKNSDRFYLLASYLSNYSDEIIIGFELRLREIIKNLLNTILLKEPFIVSHKSKDQILQMMCSMIILGKDICDYIMQHYPSLPSVFVEHDFAECVLGIADSAFNMKHKTNQGLLPSDYGVFVHEYL